MRAVASNRPWQTAVDPIAKGSDPAAVWLKYGLKAPRFRRPPPLDPKWGALPRGDRFRLALGHLGAEFALFGRFLAGRLDLLPDTHCAQLSGISYPRLNLPVSVSLRSALEGLAYELVFMGAAACSESHRGFFRGRPVVVEIFQGGVPVLEPEAWKSFCAVIQKLDDEIEQPITRAAVLEEFRQWLALQSDVSRKREILKNLQALPPGCVTRIPRPVPELETESVLAYEWIEGSVLEAELLRRRAAGLSSLGLVIESLLEQSLLLSFVPVDCHPSNLCITPDGGVCFRVFPAALPVPAEFNFELSQYTASSIAGDTARAIRMLARMVRGQAEHRLWKEFAALQPLLKIRIVTPASITAMEHYWRALSGVGAGVPLFLQLFHRQFALWGQYNGDVAPATDLFPEGLWPVLGRILRFRTSEVASLQKAKEWVVGAGLLAFATTRQVGLTLEQMRDNDISLIVEAGEDRAAEEQSSRFTASVIGFAILLALFVSSLQVAFRAATPAFKIGSSVVALVCGLGLFALVLRAE